MFNGVEIRVRAGACKQNEKWFCILILALRWDFPPSMLTAKIGGKEIFQES